jgi:hypothetical protein
MAVRELIESIRDTIVPARKLKAKHDLDSALLAPRLYIKSTASFQASPYRTRRELVFISSFIRPQGPLPPSPL